MSFGGLSTARAAKCTTLSWNDFFNARFLRGDVPLNATLQFSTPDFDHNIVLPVAGPQRRGDREDEEDPVVIASVEWDKELIISVCRDPN